jgi:hypothetical protein
VAVEAAGLLLQALQHLVAEAQEAERTQPSELVQTITELLEPLELVAAVVVVKKADPEQLSLDT